MSATKICHLVSYYNTNALYRHLFDHLAELKFAQEIVSPHGFAKPKGKGDLLH